MFCNNHIRNQLCYSIPSKPSRSQKKLRKTNTRCLKKNIGDRAFGKKLSHPSDSSEFIKRVLESQEINGIVRDCSIETIQKHPMALTQTRKQELMSEYQVHETDTGSPDLQIALLTERISQLTGHLQANPKDHASRRGLLKMISQRRRLLDYIKSREVERYQALIKRLGIRR